MENKNFTAAVEEFISQRINDCENNEVPGVSAAQADFDKTLSKADTKRETVLRMHTAGLKVKSKIDITEPALQMP